MHSSVGQQQQQKQFPNSSSSTSSSCWTLRPAEEEFLCHFLTELLVGHSTLSDDVTRPPQLNVRRVFFFWTGRHPGPSRLCQSNRKESTQLVFRFLPSRIAPQHFNFYFFLLLLLLLLPIDKFTAISYKKFNTRAPTPAAQRPMWNPPKILGGNLRRKAGKAEPLVDGDLLAVSSPLSLLLLLLLGLLHRRELRSHRFSPPPHPLSKGKTKSVSFPFSFSLDGTLICCWGVMRRQSE